MQALLRTLQDHDHGFLRIIAEVWGLELPAGPRTDVAVWLANEMLDPQSLADFVEGLPESARRPLLALLENGGQLPLATLFERYGPLREMGPGRRDRERPWRDPASPLEVLWYAGLLGRAFRDGTSGPQEFGFLPTDVQERLPAVDRESSLPGRPSEEEPGEIERADSAAVDDAVTLLAGLRRFGPPEDPKGFLKRLGPYLLRPAAGRLLLHLLADLEVISRSDLDPDPERTRILLEMPRAAILQRLIGAWWKSSTWNDLAQVPELEIAGEAWPNEPLTGRQALISFLTSVPPGTWWDIDSVVDTVRSRAPGFQRPGRDFDSWYLQERSSGRFLRGIEHWDMVEGGLLRYILQGPLHWLGMTDLGRRGPSATVSSFRLTALATLLRGADSAPELPTPPARVQLAADGRFTLTRGVSPPLRYQAARFARWEGLDSSGYHFRLTASSLEHARASGLQPAHVLRLLEELSGASPPPSLAQAVERWSEAGTEARLETSLVLTLNSPDLVDNLLKNKATARLLGERLGPTAVSVQQENFNRLLAAAARSGLLIHLGALEDPGRPG